MLETEQILRLLCTCQPENISLAEQLAQGLGIELTQLLKTKGFGGLGVQAGSDFKPNLLQKLDISSQIGFEALRYFPKTENVKVGKTVQSLSGIEILSQLRTLLCYGGIISDLTPIQSLTRLMVLACYKTPISDFAPIRNLLNLESLSVSYTQVSDLEPFKNLNKLKNLNLNHTKITDISPISGLKNLETLWCGNTSISDFSPLLGLARLQTLYCSEHQIRPDQIKALQAQNPALEIIQTPI